MLDDFDLLREIGKGLLDRFDLAARGILLEFERDDVLSLPVRGFAWSWSAAEAGETRRRERGATVG